MLKVLFFNVLIISGCASWFGVQVRIFMGAFLLGLCGLREFFLGGLTSRFGVDYAGYILILLRF